MSPDYDRAGGVRSDIVEYTFTEFDPGEEFRFNLDSDFDSGGTSTDFRTVLFPSGELILDFDNGQILSQVLAVTDITPLFYTFDGP